MNQNTDRVLGGAVLALTALVLVANYWNNWPVDLSALYFAAHFYEAGAVDLVYAPGGEMFWDQAPDDWQRLAAEHGRPDALVPAFVYPPIWAWLLGPVTQHVGFVTFANIALIAMVLALVISVVTSFDVARRLAVETGKTFPSFLVWCVISAFTIGFTSVGVLSLQLLQPQILVSLLLILMLHLLLRRQDAVAGGVLALAAAIKLMPAMLVLFLVMEKRWRALGAFVGVGAVLGLGSILIVGWPLHQALLERIASLDAEVLVTRLSIGIELVLFHMQQVSLGATSWQINQPIMVEPPSWIALVSRLVFIFGLIFVWWSTHRLPEVTRLWTRFILVYLIVVIASPLAWLHYLLLPMLLLPGLLSLRRDAGVRMMLILAGAIMSFPVFMWLLDYSWAGYLQVYLHFGLVVAFTVLLSASARQSQC